jgi:ferredoxin
VPECPINAIYAEDDLPEDQQEFIKLNAQLAKKWPIITDRKPGLPDAKEWENKPDKRKQLAQ